MRHRARRRAAQDQGLTSVEVLRKLSSLLRAEVELQ